MVKSKKIVYLLLASIITVLISCGEPSYKSSYIFDNYTLIRIDEGDDVYLYVGDNKENYIVAHPSGFNGIVSGYIIFNNNSIDVLPDEGNFKLVGNNKMLQLKEVDAETLLDLDEAKYNLENNGSLMKFYMYVWGEARQNSRINCKIKAIYDTALLNRGNRQGG
jgi:hypothetical protein